MNPPEKYVLKKHPLKGVTANILARGPVMKTPNVFAPCRLAVREAPPFLKSQAKQSPHARHW
jgi:hypothetical protein